MRIIKELPALVRLTSNVWSRYRSALLPVRVKEALFSAHLFKLHVRFSSSELSALASGHYIQCNSYVTVSSCKFMRDKHVADLTLDSSDENSVHNEAYPVGKRRFSPIEVMKLLYDDIMSAPKWLTCEEWSAVGRKLQQQKPVINNWPTVLLRFIASKTETIPELYSVGMSLVDYAKSLSSSYSAPLAVSAIAIHVHQGGASCHQQAFALYDELCTRHDVLDSDSALILITAFAKTSRWRLCFELIEMVKLTGSPRNYHYSPIIVAALMNNESTVAHDLLVKLSEIGQMPTVKVFHYMISTGGAEQVLTTLKDFAWIPTIQVVDYVISHLKREPLWSDQMIELATMSKTGICNQCGGILEHQPCITDEEFSELRQEFMHRSLMREGNIFLQTSPEELSMFNNFLHQKQSRPFTIVFDGLNIACGGPQWASAKLKSQILQHAIDYFSRRGHHILIFGRQHMSQWEVYRHSNDYFVEWFFTENVSSDDPFMLYAALYFGRDTFIVTKDQLRDHRFVLGTKLAKRLKLWQRQRQITFSLPNNRQYFKWPVHYNTAVQKSTNAWHVPFDDGLVRASYNLPDSWYCIWNRSNH